MSKREAVGILLTGNPDSSELYLVERNPKLKFFGGYFALPGGTLDAEDSGQLLSHSSATDRELLPYIMAGAREIFEETGIFVGRGGTVLSRDRLAGYRRDLLSGNITFSEILKREAQTIDVRDFHLLASLLTPEFAPVRYNTIFFWLRIPPGQEPEIVEGELISGGFYDAAAALQMWNQGKIAIVPPVVFMLRALAGASVMEACPGLHGMARDYQQGAIHQIYFSPGVQMLPLKTQTLPPANHTNTYLVGDRKLYIVDPSPAQPEEQQRLWDYLDREIAAGREIIGILLTHYHADHTGALAVCQERYDLPAFAHQKTIERLPGIRFEAALAHDDELELGESPDGKSGWRLRALHTPGHAGGHLAFQENRYGAVLAGDMISTLSTIVISPPEGHMATYMQSLKLLESVADGTIYPGHGPALKSGQKILRHYIRHRQEREAKLLASLSGQPQTISELVRKVYDDVSPALWGLSENSLHAGLIKLIEEKQCRQSGDHFFLAV